MWQVYGSDLGRHIGSFERDPSGYEYWCIASLIEFKYDRSGRLFWSPCSRAPRLVDEEDIETGKYSATDLIPFAEKSYVSLVGKLPVLDKTGLTPTKLGLVAGSINKNIQFRAPRKVLVDGSRLRVRPDPTYESAVSVDLPYSLGGQSLLTDDNSIHSENMYGSGWIGSQVCDRASLDVEEFSTPAFEPVGAKVDAFINAQEFVTLAQVPRHFVHRRRAAGSFESGAEKTEALGFPKNFSNRFYLPVQDDQITEDFINTGTHIIIAVGDHLISMRIPEIDIYCETIFRGSLYRSSFDIIGIQIDAFSKKMTLILNTKIYVGSNDHKVEDSYVHIDLIKGIHR